MKIAFYKKNELSELLNELLNKSSEKKLSCEVTYSEELQTDVALVTVDGELQNTIEIWDLFSEISEHLNVEITNYDVIEVGDFGEGFVFFF